MIEEDVKKFFQNELSGHGFDHAIRVRDMALKIADTEVDSNQEVIILAALLHDVDDYKLFGAPNANDLPNARQIMTRNGVDNDTQLKVIHIIQNMGYSKALKGVYPTSIEGKIVSDADMLDAMGAFGIIRTIVFSATMNRPIFDAQALPETDGNTYTNHNRSTNTAINHFFEKLLKLRTFLFTNSAKQMAESRHTIMVNFLSHFFDEQNQPHWQKMLEKYQ